MAKFSKTELKIAKELAKQCAWDALNGIPGVSEVQDIKVGYDKDAEEFIVDLFIIAKFGEKIPALSWDVQNSVKESINKDLKYIKEIHVKSINIHISGVN